MKNQYVGDINDFRKYGLIRALTKPGNLSTLCCWLLTPDDGSPDGEKTHYLTDPANWRSHDPALFDALASVVADSTGRSVASVEALGVLKRTSFHSDSIPDDVEGRDDYFAKAAPRFANTDLVFFDPDNGLEVSSRRKGRKGSSKYLYWDEVERAFGAGASVLLYQHFPREERASYTKRRARELLAATGAPWVRSFSTSHVLFLLAPQLRHETTLTLGSRLAAERWGGQFTIDVHSGGAEAEGGARYLRSPRCNGNPLEQALIRRWWYEEHGARGRIVWEYSLPLAGGGIRYVDAIWLMATGETQAEADGAAFAGRPPLEGPLVVCEAKSTLTPELVGQALVYRGLVERAGGDISRTVIFAARGDEAEREIAESLGLTVVLRPLG